MLATYGLNVIGALAIIVIGFIAAGWARRALERALSRSGHVDATIVRFFGSLLRYAIIAFVVIAALQRFGVEATSLVAVFGAAGLAIGLALQGTLSNAAAGVMLLMFRPFKIGDFIDAGGQSGTVKEVGLFTTEMATPDNVKIIVPNGAIWGQAIKNFSGNPTRRVDVVVGIAYGDD
ncbi:MAG: mechanosensitive ion channel domain-containing protein, partial [Rhodospirillaceae bacterium]